MTTGYKDFINFLDENVQTDNELDIIIYNIGTVQKIVEQFSYFFNQKIEQKVEQNEEYDIVDLEIEFEMQCNEKIHLALGIGDESTLFVESEYRSYDMPITSDIDPYILLININKKLIATLTLEGMRNDL